VKSSFFINVFFSDKCNKKNVKSKPHPQPLSKGEGSFASRPVSLQRRGEFLPHPQSLSKGEGSFASPQPLSKGEGSFYLTPSPSPRERGVLPHAQSLSKGEESFASPPAPLQSRGECDFQILVISSSSKKRIKR